MSAWSSFIALNGFAYNGAKKAIVLNPRWKPARFVSFWFSGVGWGAFTLMRLPKGGNVELCPRRQVAGWFFRCWCFLSRQDLSHRGRQGGQARVEARSADGRVCPESACDTHCRQYAEVVCVAAPPLHNHRRNRGDHRYGITRQFATC